MAISFCTCNARMPISICRGVNTLNKTEVMTAIIIKGILIIVAVICSAVTDTISQHPKTTILTGKFWQLWPHNKFIPFTKYPLDGWHLCKSLMVLSLLAIGFVDYLYTYQWYYVAGAYLLTGGLLWILPFNLFYNKILKKK